MFAYCNNNPVNNADPLGLFSFGDLFKGVSLLSIGIAACVAAVTVVTAGACAPLAIAAAVTFGAGAVTAVNGASEVTEAVTGYNPVRDTLYGGNSAAYEKDRDRIATIAQVGTIAINTASALNLCFVAGTLIKSEDGLIPIEEIEPGDLVWAWDEETGTTALKPVVETYLNETNELTHILVAGEEIVCTPGHPFYSPVKGWAEACRLRAGDILVLVNGEYVVVEKVQHELLEAPIKVYNFEVQHFHTYCVASGVVVHNTCGETPIYRRGGTNPGNLTPRGKDIESGLSFTTEYVKGAAQTTIEQVNSTGLLRAVQDGVTHVSVKPVGATIQEWIVKGSTSIWTAALKRIVTKS